MASRQKMANGTKSREAATTTWKVGVNFDIMSGQPVKRLTLTSGMMIFISIDSDQ